MAKPTRQQVFDKYNGMCAYCGRCIDSKRFQIDHITPISCQQGRWDRATQKVLIISGDVNHIDNLNPACRKCNHYKRANTLEGFRLLMNDLHKRILAIYIVEVGQNFGMLEVKPFDGLFYFEKIEKHG